MIISFIDSELEMLIMTGSSRTYKCLARKGSHVRKLKQIYNTITIKVNRSEGLDGLLAYKSYRATKHEDGTFTFPIDDSDTIFMVVLLRENVVEIHPLKILERNERQEVNRH